MTANDTKSMLNDLQIASPCSVPWATMGETDSDAVRFCGQCSKKVYDISQLTTAEAGLLIQQGEAGGNMACMQLYRRFDGTVITDDCPVGLRRIRDSWRRLKSSAAAALALFCVSIPAFAQNNIRAEKGKVAIPSEQERALRGEPVMLGGKPMMSQPTGGMVAPNVINPAADKWQAVAMSKPSVKSISEKIEKLEKKGNLSKEEKLKVMRLRLQMAQEADKQKVPAFAQCELKQLQVSAQNAVLGKQAEKSLMQDILKARINNAQILKVDDSEFKTQLTKLESGK